MTNKLKIGDACIYVDEKGETHNAIVCALWRKLYSSIGVVFATEMPYRESLWPFSTIQIKIAGLHEPGMSGNYVMPYDGKE